MELCKDTKIKLLEARQAALESIIVVQEKQNISTQIQLKYQQLHSAVEREYPGCRLTDNLELIEVEKENEDADTPSS